MEEFWGLTEVTMPARRSFELTSRERTRSEMGMMRAGSGRDMFSHHADPPSDSAAPRYSISVGVGSSPEMRVRAG